MSVILPFDGVWLSRLLGARDYTLRDKLGASGYTARIAIPDFRNKVASYYKDVLPNGLDEMCRRVELPCDFTHFGVIIEFDQPTELSLHDEQMSLTDGLHQIIARTGPVIIRNAFLDSVARDQGHRNRFPHLNFHVDRSMKQVTRYSMYTRNPHDAEQQYPRTSSTLFTAKIVGYLQSVREGTLNPDTDKGCRGTYSIFQKTNMGDVLDNVVLEHAWDLPRGTGEISMLDNADCLHASYYRDPSIKGYKIGVRYVA
jgi:hypothetical protein